MCLVGSRRSFRDSGRVAFAADAELARRRLARVAVAARACRAAVVAELGVFARAGARAWRRCKAHKAALIITLTVAARICDETRAQKPRSGLEGNKGAISAYCKRVYGSHRHV